MAHHLTCSPRRLTRRAFSRGALTLAAALTLNSITRTRDARAASLPNPLSNFVPAEVCVVVTANAGDPKLLYAAVRTWLNAKITSLVRGASAVNPLDPRDRELNPGSLRPYLGQPNWLVPQPPGPLSAWVVLDPPVQGTLRQTLLFYSTGVGQAGVDDLTAIVRRIVNVINLNLRLDGGSPEQAFHVDAATPNWYTAAASAHTCGGPGGRAEPAPVADWRLRFINPTIESTRVAAANKAIALGRSDVIVAVLDTSPEPAAVANAARAYPTNRLLDQVSRNVSVGQAPSLTTALATPVDSSTPVLPEWYGAQNATGLATEDFRMDDHGLMVAGIVRDLAPKTDVRLVRVLGDYGVGTLQGLAPVLNRVQASLNPGGKRRLIVNLSLMVDIPASHKIVERWFPGLSGVPDDPALQAALAPLDASIRAPIQALNRQGAFVIAAAGNDALPSASGTPVRPLPRFPARIDSVLSVAALKRDGTPASYSNQATVPGQPLKPFGPATSNGVAVFGGEAALRSGWWGPPPAPQNPPVAGLPALFGPRFINLAPGAVPVDAIVGVASAPRPALSRVRNATTGAVQPPNTTGWSYWVGTSFAAPIVSSLAAAIWELDPALQPADVRAIVQSYAQTPVSGLGCSMMSVIQG